MEHPQTPPSDIHTILQLSAQEGEGGVTSGALVYLVTDHTAIEGVDPGEVILSASSLRAAAQQTEFMASRTGSGGLYAQTELSWIRVPMLLHPEYDSSGALLHPGGQGTVRGLELRCGSDRYQVRPQQIDPMWNSLGYSELPPELDWQPEAHQ